MIKIANYSISSIYQGGYSSLDPNKSYGSIFTGYHVPASELGAPTKIDTANQIQQVNMLLNQGIVPIEVGALDPKIFDQIPKQHFKEMNRMMKLAGGKASVHAPLIEPSGVTDQGWNENNRKMAEEQLIDVINKSHDLDPAGGMPITIHSTGLPGTEYEMTADGKRIQKIVVINQETGKPAPIEREVKYYPSRPGELIEGTILKPEEEVKTLNRSEWSNALSELIHFKEGADRVMLENSGNIEKFKQKLQNKEIDLHTGKGIGPDEEDVFGHITNARTYLDDARLKIQGMFNKAYKYGTDEDKKILKNASQEYAKALRSTGSLNIKQQSRIIQNMIGALEEVQPDLYIPIEQFSLEKSSETFANVALKSYNKFKDKAPTISIENMFPGMAFAYKQEKGGPPGMNELIMETKRKFVDKAVSEGVMSEGAAQAQADKMIGMTLDVGHLNIAKKAGLKDKDLVKEVEAIAKHVKHVHLTDNFGYSDSHLPPGMGNVPFKSILEELDKKGFTGRKVVEAAGFVQHFGKSPLPYSLAGMGTGITTEATGPYWQQSPGLYQGYSSGFGLMLPGINYQTFGAGFSRLPTDLGGQMPGAQGSRMSGTPME